MLSGPFMRRRVLLPALLCACAVPLQDRPGGRDEPILADRPLREGIPEVDVVFPDPLVRPERAREQEILAAIGRLWSNEFTVYTNACRQLVEAGELAVPYLGYFGDARKELQPGQTVDVTRIVLETILRDLPADRVEAALRSPYRPVRVSAAHVAGARGLVEVTPRLLDLLDADEEADREAAVYGLRSLHNRYFDYRPGDPPARREAAAARWRAWWAERSTPTGTAATE
jgi:hypothetical protein